MESVKSLFNDTSGIKTLITIIVLLVIYFLLFKMGAYVINWAFGHNKSPYIFRGKIKIEDNIDKRIHTNPNANVFVDDNIKETKNVKVIYRSTNQSGGIEFTWMTWLYVDGRSFPNPMQRNKRHTMHIFNKGAKPIPSSGDTELANVAHMSCPALYLETFPEDELAEMQKNNLIKHLDNDHNNMRLRIDCNTHSQTSVFETAYVHNIPINKWMHIVIRVIGHNLDVYINGRIKKRLQMYNTPLQNYGDIYLFANSGAEDLKGEMSDLRYFNYALESRTIEHFTEKGPTLQPSRDVDMTTNVDDTPYYLTQRWFYKDYLT